MYEPVNVFIKRIENSLRSAPAVTVQRLAEAMAGVKWPNRFRDRQLVIHGRNDEEQTTKGWPDAYSHEINGSIHAVEATRNRSTWFGHLEEDLRTLEKRPDIKLASYFFVGGYPTHSPTVADVNKYRVRFAKLGMQDKDVTILVGQDLAEELAGPQYAQICQTLLGVDIVPSAFRLLQPGQLWDQTLASFQPTLADFEAGIVWEPPLVEEILAELTHGKAVLVRGHGASGKTTLAQLLCLKSSASIFYYLDLAGSAYAGIEVGAALNDMIKFGGTNVTFVVDNIHLDHETAMRLYDHWRHKCRLGRSNILLLGREIALAKGTSFADLVPKILRAQSNALLGTARRLLIRAGHEPVAPPEHVVQSWIRTFGGNPTDRNLSVDLIAFGAACERRLPNLARGQFTLNPSDATEAVQNRYLAPLDMEERANLIRVAVFSQFEIALPAIALPHPMVGFPVSQSMNGLVLADEHGMDRRRVYRLSHPAIGILIIRAAMNVDQQSERLAGALGEPSIGLWLLHQLQSGDERTKMLHELGLTLRSLTWVKNYVGLQPIISIIKAGSRNNLLDSEFPTRLAASSDLKDAYLAERSVHFLNEFHLLIDRFLYQEVRASLTAIADAHGAEILEKLSASSISDIDGFARTHPAGYPFLRKIDAKAWQETQSSLRQPPPSHVLNAAKRLEERGLVDLAIPPVSALIRNPDPSEWHSRHGPSDFSHLAQALRFGVDVPVEDKRRFLSVFDSTPWLEEQYNHIKPGTLAASLMSLANYLDDELKPLLHRTALAERVRRELSTVGDSQKDLIRALALLGATTLMRLTVSMTGIVWPGEDAVAEAINQRATTGNTPILGMYELQLWTGIHAMASLSVTQYKLPTSASAAFLQRLKQSSPPTLQARETKDRLRVWLEACEQCDWLLQVPVPECAS